MTTMTNANKDMHARSGQMHSPDPLVALIYDLLRDHIHPGDLEQLVRDNCASGMAMRTFSNGWLAQYAEDIVQRISQARTQNTAGGAIVTKEGS